MAMKSLKEDICRHRTGISSTKQLFYKRATHPVGCCSMYAPRYREILRLRACSIYSDMLFILE